MPPMTRAPAGGTLDATTSDAPEVSTLGDEQIVAGLAIPDDPTVLSYLLSGIVQVELPRRQRLLEAATTVQRLEALVTLLDREVLLLGLRLRLSVPDQAMTDGSRRS